MCLHKLYGDNRVISESKVYMKDQEYPVYGSRVTQIEVLNIKTHKNEVTRESFVVDQGLG